MTNIRVIIVGAIFLLYAVESSCEARSSAEGVLVSRHRRQSPCPRDWWHCGGHNDNCINKYLVCDGRADCDTGADETEYTCRNIHCAKFAFRCAYGGCVSGDALCNGTRECHDGSDELQPECNRGNPSKPTAANGCRRDEFRCASGQCVPTTATCDGAADCTDASDETREECSATQCPPFAYRCRYGACVRGDALCNGVRECYDGSDEDSSTCRTSQTQTYPLGPTSTSSPFTRPTVSDSTSCSVPDDPTVRYIVPATSEVVSAGTKLSQYSVLQYDCKDNNLQNFGAREGICKAGNWTAFPRCTKTCKLSESATYKAKCKLNHLSPKEDCPSHVPVGATVYQECIAEYVPRSDLTVQICMRSGEFDVPLQPCKPICGKVIPKGVPFVIGGTIADYGEFPWHAAIYSDYEKPHAQICGGSIINAFTVLSAAHCFYANEGGIPTKIPIEQISVAVGKMARDWNTRTHYTQYKNLGNLIIHHSYSGFENGYTGDIAILILKTEITFNHIVRPVCIDPNPASEVSPREEGIVAGWGLTQEHGNASEDLKWIKLPRVDHRECREQSPIDFRPFLTPDKFCAGYLNGSSVCRGDSGGGLCFPTKTRQGIQYYIKGIVSIGPNNGDTCNSYKYTAFTDVSKYLDWLQNNDVLRGVL